MRSKSKKPETGEVAESYRRPMSVTHLRQFRTTSYYFCPRCWKTMEREYMAYCDRCGQCLQWRHSENIVVLETSCYLYRNKGSSY